LQRPVTSAAIVGQHRRPRRAAVAGGPAGGLLGPDVADDPGRAGPQGTLADLEAGDLTFQHPLGGGTSGVDLRQLGGPLPPVRLLLAGVLRGGVVDVGGAGAPVDHRLLGVHLQLP